MKATRGYRMQARADAVRATRRRILEAALRLFSERFFEDVSLDEVARRARVTVQTLIRHFATKHGLLEGCIAEFRPEVHAQRDEGPAGDVRGAVANLFDHYEAWSPTVLRLLAQEDRVPAYRRVTDEGRAFHRGWVGRVFGAFVAPLPDRAARRRRLGALVAATDVYAWKVLRRDLGLGRAEAEAAVRETVDLLCGRRR